MSKDKEVVKDVPKPSTEKPDVKPEEDNKDKRRKLYEKFTGTKW